MFVSAMDLGWKRVHHLVVILIFLKHAVGHEGWFSQNLQPQENWPVHKRFSPGGIQSSVLEAPVTGSIPVEEVAPNMLLGKSPSASRSRFSLSHQYVKGGSSSSYGPMSHTQSSPSVSDSVSQLLQLQGSSSPHAQSVVSQSDDRQDSYSWSSLSSPDGSSLQGVSAQLASTPVRGGGSSGLSIPSHSSSSLSTPDSLSKLIFSPLAVSGLPSSSQSSSNMFTASSQNSSGLQLGGTSSLLSKLSSSSTGSSGSSRRLFTATYQGSSGPQLAGSSSQLVSTSGLLTQPLSAESQDTSRSSYVKIAPSPLGFSQATSGQSNYRQYSLSSQSRVGTQLAASHRYVPGQGSSSLSVQPQGTTSQYAPAFSLGAKPPMSSQYYQTTQSGSLSPSQSSQGGPSITRTQGFQASSTAVLQGSGTSQSSSWSPSRFSSLSSQGTSSQNVPVPLGAKVPVYSQAAPSGSWLSLSQPSQLRPASTSQSFQTSDTVASQSSSPSQGSKVPSRFSTSRVSPGQLSSIQGSGRYDGLFGHSQSASTLYSPGSPVYAKPGSSLLDLSSQSASGQSSYSKYTLSSQSRAGAKPAGSSPTVPVLSGSTLTGSSLHLQGTSAQYVPAPLDAKVPVYRQTSPSGSLSLSKPPQWLPSSRWSQSFQTSGTVASQSSSPSQGSKVPSIFSTSALSPGQLASTQGSDGYSGLSSLSQSTSHQYSPGSSGYTKPAASPLGVSQSTIGQSSYSQYTSSSQNRAGTQLAGSSHYAAPSQGSKTPTKLSTLISAASPGQFVSTQKGSGSYIGLSSPSQSTSSPYSSGSPAYAERGSSLSSQSTSGPSSSGLYASSSQSMAGTQLAGSSSYVPVRKGTTFTGASFQFQGASNQYAPSVSSQYTQASPSESSTGSDAFRKWQPSASTLSQWFQASGTAVPQSSSFPQSSQISSGSSFLPALSPSVDSVAQSSISSSQRTSSFFGTGLRPSKLSAQAVSGSAIGSQISPGLSASVHQPSGSMTSSPGSSVPGALQGMFSGQSSDSTLFSSSYGYTYGQKATGSSRPSQSSSASGRYSSSVKG
uniref:Hornerin-like n=1 Tax=Cyprinus carpio TaxID=7962 RepID=A0A8C1R0U7_CYPCA